MNFNIGAGQIYYEDAAPTRSQLNFATKINFLIDIIYTNIGQII